MSQFVANPLAYNEWFRSKVQEGIGVADRGALMPHDEVVASAEKQKAELLAKYGDK